MLGEEEKRAGSLAEVAAFSFYPGKNLGAMGEGGAVTTDDEQMYRNMRIWRDHGQSERYIHVSPDGWNARLDALQCAVLDIKLSKLDEWNAVRQRAAGWYRDRLSGEEAIVLPTEPHDKTHVYHLFVVRLPDRARTRQELSAQGIGVGRIILSIALAASLLRPGVEAGDFLESEAAAASVLSLPMFPHITEEQVDRVCDLLRRSVLGAQKHG
jgi:dTDP-4-amino-4,6-dideoxygalactose transaminase